MPSDFEFLHHRSFGEWLHGELSAHVQFEAEGWALERARRVGERLQAHRPPEARLIVEVPWLADYTAFTAPGRYIYFCRALIECCPDDETAAFVVAHEIAHHHLGHVALFPSWLEGIATHLHGSELLAGVFKGIESRIYGPERETAADRYGLQLCADAGYSPEACLAVLDILEIHALDLGDVNIVFGPSESDEELSPDAPLATRLRLWLWQRARGYLPLRDRRAALRHYLSQGPRAGRSDGS